MQIALTVIWILFTILFAVLALWHFRQASHSMPHIMVDKRPLECEGSQVQMQMIIGGMELDQPLRAFADEFNKYLDGQNSSSCKVHHLSACGYGLASLTSALSILVQVRA